MSAPEQARAKINLSLRITGRRADGYHELESLVAFADIADALTLAPADTASLDVAGPFAAQCGTVGNNLVLKATAALQALLTGLATGNFALTKNLPVAAGLGGGSADAAAALRLLARHNGMALDDSRLAEAALAVGADVPVCLASTACIMRGVGERLSAPVALPPLAAVLVNPGVPLETRAVFGRFAPEPVSEGAADRVPTGFDDFIEWLGQQGNDLTSAAIACAPIVADVLDTLGTAPGARLARMSGSGATCFALFTSVAEAEAAARQLQAERPAWWIAATRLS